MNKKGLIFIISFLVLGAVLLTVLIIRQRTFLISNRGVSSLQTQEKEIQGVGVLVTPTVQNKEVIFDISMQSHTVELAEDLMQISELKDQSGKVYKALAWEGAPAGGHHRAGLLKFILDSKPREITLTIRQFRAEDLIFSWEVNNSVLGR